MGTKILGWLIVIGVAGGAVAYFTTRVSVIEVTADRIKRGHVETTITAISSGTIRTKTDVMLVAEHLGKVVEVHVADGERVTKDQILIELAHAELDAHVALAEANVRAAEARLEQAKLGAAIYEDLSESRVNQSSAQRRQAQEDYERLKALAEKQIIPQMEVDRLGLALDVARESEVGARASARESTVREQEIASAEAFLDQVKASLDLAVSARDKAYVRAPFDGVVADVIVDPGAGVAHGVPVVHMIDDSSIYVEAPFDEANASQITTGLMARITVDTYRGEAFFGFVEYIPPVVAINMDLSRTLNVKVRLDGDNDKLIAGMSADVVLLVEQKDDVLYIPAENLVQQKYAFVIEDGIAVQRDVELGIGNWFSYEVLSGLEEGEQFITSVGLRELSDGVAVEVVEELGL